MKKKLSLNGVCVYVFDLVINKLSASDIFRSIFKMLHNKCFREGRGSGGSSGDDAHLL